MEAKITLITKFALLAIIVALMPFSAYAIPGSISVDVDGTSVNVEYDAEGVEVLGVQSDLDFVSLIFDVDVSGSPGILEITFDRSFFDSKFEGTDDDFIIIADGDEPTFEETLTSEQSRTLRIELPNGTDEVEIIGTEFGDGTTVVLEDEPQVEDLEPIIEKPKAPVVEPEPPVEVPPTPIKEPITPTKEPVEEKPKTECGPGTILQDGVCVLDKRCGPGTILQDGVCVLSPTTAPSGPSLDSGSSKELVIGAVAAFVISFAVIILFYIISRANREKN